MFKGQTSVRNGIQDFLCPFTTLYVTQWSNGEYSHKGTCAMDFQGSVAGAREPYYAPADVKCVWALPSHGQAMWQTINKVRCANGYIGIVTFVTAHDDSFDATAGMIIKQGVQLGNMGMKGNATGVHCHLQISQSADTTWYVNSYGNYRFNTEAEVEDVCFMDNTVRLNWDFDVFHYTTEGSKPDVDDILYPGEYAAFLKNNYVAEKIDVPNQKALIDFGPYKGWVACALLADGNDEVLYTNESCHFSPNRFKVLQIDVPNQTALLEGFDFYVDCSLLVEVV